VQHLKLSNKVSFWVRRGSTVLGYFIYNSVGNLD